MEIKSEADLEMRVNLGSKLDVYHLLEQEERLYPFLPKTELFSKESLLTFLVNFPGVIIKPIFSYGGGKGVIKLVTSSEELYEVHTKNQMYRFDHLDKAYQFVSNEIATNPYSKPYIIQQLVDLVTVFNKPMDFRYLVQRKIGGEWLVSGKYAKVAPDGYFVTNLKNAGELLSMENAIHCLEFEDSKLHEILNNMNTFALSTAQQLSRFFTKKNMWGLDIGVDKYGDVWLIEANSRPGNGAFRLLEDQTMKNVIKSITAFNKEVRRAKRRGKRKS